MSLLADHYLGGFRREHPYGNLQPLPTSVNDRHRAVSPFRSAKDLNGSATERMKRIEDLDLTIFWTQGIVGVGVLIPICIVWSREEDSLPIIAAGFPVDLSSFCPSKCSVWYSGESSWPVWSELLSNTSSLSLANWLLCNRPQLLPLYCAPPPIVTGSSMPSDRLPDRSKSLPIFLVILTASPSPTLASWLWSMARSPSVGATIPMATRIEP